MNIGQLRSHGHGRGQKKDWLLEGRTWLISKQRETGEFESNQSGIDQFPFLNTAFALRFLETEID